MLFYIIVQSPACDSSPKFEFIKTWLDTPGWPPYTPDLSDGEELTGPAERTADIFSSVDEKVLYIEISHDIHFKDSRKHR